MKTFPICPDCGKPATYKYARGLCASCYGMRQRNGTLHERPTLAQRSGGGLADAPDGCTYRQLDYWVRKGYLRVPNATPGSGSWRTWPRREVVVAEKMARLVAAGIPPAVACRVARGDSEIAPGVRVVVRNA